LKEEMSTFAENGVFVSEKRVNFGDETIAFKRESFISDKFLFHEDNSLGLKC